MRITEFSCPACAAPLSPQSSTDFLRCPYCQSTLRITHEGRREQGAARATNGAARRAELAESVPVPDTRPTWQRLVTLFLVPIGRISRAHFVLGILVLLVMLVLLSPFVPEGETDRVTGFPGLMILLILYSYAALAIKRYHDIGKSGGWFFIAFIPLGVFWQWYDLFSQPGDARKNCYGERPLQKAGDLFAPSTKVAVGIPSSSTR